MHAWLVSRKNPQYQLSDEEIITVLADLHISQAAVEHLSLSLRDSMTNLYLEQVLTINEIPKEIFETDYHQLKEDPEKLKIIYDKVINRLNELKLGKFWRG